MRDTETGFNALCSSESALVTYTGMSKDPSLAKTLAKLCVHVHMCII